MFFIIIKYDFVRKGIAIAKTVVIIKNTTLVTLKGIGHLVIHKRNDIFHSKKILFEFQQHTYKFIVIHMPLH